jgi:hypothetical protein
MGFVSSKMLVLVCAVVIAASGCRQLAPYGKASAAPDADRPLEAGPPADAGLEGPLVADAIVSEASTPADGSANDVLGPPAPGRVCNGDGWCWEHPLPQGSAINALAAPAPGVWIAVGENGTVLLEQAGVLTRVELSPGHGYPALNAVWAQSAKEFIVAGEGGAVYRYSSGQMMSIGDASLGDLRGVTSVGGDVWAVGDLGVFKRSSSGGGWLPAESFPAAAVWSSPTGELYIVGESAWRFENGTLKKYPGCSDPGALGCQGKAFTAVSGAATGQAVAVDAKGCLYRLLPSSCVSLGHDANQRSLSAVWYEGGKAYAIGNGVHCRWDPTPTFLCKTFALGARALAGTASELRAAVGDRGAVHQVDRGTLASAPLPRRVDQTSDPLVAATSAGGELWALAGTGRSLRLGSGSWSSWKTGVTAYAIAASSTGKTSFVGAAGALLVGDASLGGFTNEVPRAGASVLALADVQGEIWLGGEFKSGPWLSRRDGSGAFTAVVTSGPNGSITGEVRAALAQGGAQVLVATDQGSLAFYDQGSLTGVDDFPSIAWSALAGRAATTIIAVGSNGISGVIYERPAGAASWNKVTLGLTQPLRGVATDGQGRWVAVGEKGAVYTKNGTQAWQQSHSGVLRDLSAVVYHQGRFYAVGHGGIVLSYGFTP